MPLLLLLLLPGGTRSLPISLSLSGVFLFFRLLMSAPCKWLWIDFWLHDQSFYACIRCIWYEYHLLLLLLRIEISTDNCTVTSILPLYDPQLWSWDMIVCCFFLVISTRAPCSSAKKWKADLRSLHTCVVKRMIFYQWSLHDLWSCDLVIFLCTCLYALSLCKSLANQQRNRVLHNDWVISPIVDPRSSIHPSSERLTVYSMCECIVLALVSSLFMLGSQNSI